VGTPPGDEPRRPIEGISPPADHRVERPRVEGGQPSERSGAHGRRADLPTGCQSGGPRRPASVTDTAHNEAKVSPGALGVRERGGDPPGPIPNPVVPPASAGAVLGGRPPGKSGPCAQRPWTDPRSQEPAGKQAAFLSASLRHAGRRTQDAVLPDGAGWSSGSSLGS
jgi:hypothetical protein